MSVKVYFEPYLLCDFPNSDNFFIYSWNVCSALTKDWINFTFFVRVGLNIVNEILIELAVYCI